MTRIYSTSRRVTIGVVATLTVGALTGCGLGTAGGFVPSNHLAGPVAGVKSLHGASIAVGSKPFTEQIILGKMAVLMLKAAGADVKDFTGIPGSAAARQAERDGQIQFMYEYTGTAWMTYLGKSKPITNPRAQFNAVRDLDAKNGITWLDPAPLNNTYSLGSTKATLAKYGVKDFADLRKVPKAARTLCVESEFANRQDGLKPMLATYGLKLGSDVPRNQIKTLDTGAIYAAIADGLCNYGEIFTTDGRIKSLNLAVLTDSKHFFPNYNVAPTVATKVYESHPQIKDLFGPVTKKLTNTTLIGLNAKVDVDGKDPAVVAEDWLKQEGFLK